MLISRKAIVLLVLSSGSQPNLCAYMASLVKPSETGQLQVSNARVVEMSDLSRSLIKTV